MLCKLGCNAGQGFLFSPALPASMALDALAKASASSRFDQAVR